METLESANESFNGAVVLVADVVFRRNIKNVSTSNQNVEVLRLFDSPLAHEDLFGRLAASSLWLAIDVLSLALNGALLFMSINKPHKRKWKKLPVLTANLALANIILSVAFIAYTLLIDVFYSAQDIEHVAIDGWKFSDFCYDALKEALKREIVNKFMYVQGVFILLLAVDRYLALFASYSAYFGCVCAPALVTLVPYVLVGVFLDYRLLRYMFDQVTALIVCLSFLVVPCLLGVVFAVCTIVRQSHGDLFYRTQHSSHIFALLFVCCVKLLEGAFVLVELVHLNFAVDFSVGDPHNDLQLSVVLHALYRVGHHLFVCSPLYIAVTLLLLVRQYRRAMWRGIRRVAQLALCRRRNDKVDYSCETMRSIIAEQTRAKRMRSFASSRIA